MAPGEIDVFLRLIKHTLDTGQPTLHVHSFRARSDEVQLRRAEITKEKPSDKYVTVFITPYP